MQEVNIIVQVNYKKYINLITKLSLEWNKNICWGSMRI
jgi:hypothetical protein